MDILKYLPNFLSKDPMFHCAAETCNEEHDRLRLALQDLADNFFVNTATWALPLYESFLGIKPGDGDSDEFRSSGSFQAAARGCVYERFHELHH